MGGEDFVLRPLGARDFLHPRPTPGQGGCTSPEFDFNDGALATGIEVEEWDDADTSTPTDVAISVAWAGVLPAVLEFVRHVEQVEHLADDEVHEVFTRGLE